MSKFVILFDLLDQVKQSAATVTSDLQASNVNITITNNFAAYIGAGLAMVTGFGSSIGQGYIGGRAIDALARNPEMEPKVFKQFLIASAVSESAAIYSLIIAIVLIFAVR